MAKTDGAVTYNLAKDMVSFYMVEKPRFKQLVGVLINNTTFHLQNTSHRLLFHCCTTTSEMTLLKKLVR